MSVQDLKNRRIEKKKQFEAYADRRDDVKKIIRNIEKMLDDEVQDVNKKIDACLSALEEGLKGTGSCAKLRNDLQDQKESSKDVTISSCRENLIKEQKRCQSKINALDEEIRALENQICEQGGKIYIWE